jgi:hypothetical protein
MTKSIHKTIMAETAAITAGKEITAIRAMDLPVKKEEPIRDTIRSAN